MAEAPEAQHSTVLIVEPDDRERERLRAVLAEEYEVVVAQNAAWAKMVTRQARPDLCLVGVDQGSEKPLQLMSELELLHPTMDFILMAPDASLLAMVLDEDASHPFYFLPQPVHGRALTVLVKRCFTKRQLSEENERTRIYREEAEAAQALHENLLPLPSGEVGGVRVECLYRPQFKLGGDFYDYVQLRDGNGMAFLLADITGHGFAPALLAGVIKTAFWEPHDRGHDPAPVIERLRASLAVCAARHFVTTFCATYRSDQRMLRYCNAGHPRAIVWGSGRPPELIDTTQTPVMGAMTDPPVLEQRAMAPGEQMLLVTDGVFEAWDGDITVAEQALMERIATCPFGGRELLEDIWTVVEARLEERPDEVQDDVTLMWLGF